MTENYSPVFIFFETKSVSRLWQVLLLPFARALCVLEGPFLQNLAKGVRSKLWSRPAICHLGTRGPALKYGIRTHPRNQGTSKLVPCRNHSLPSFTSFHPCSLHHLFIMNAAYLPWLMLYPQRTYGITKDHFYRLLGIAEMTRALHDLAVTGSVAEQSHSQPSDPRTVHVCRNFSPKPKDQQLHDDQEGYSTTHPFLLPGRPSPDPALR